MTCKARVFVLISRDLSHNTALPAACWRATATFALSMSHLLDAYAAPRPGARSADRRNGPDKTEGPSSLQSAPRRG